MNRISSSSSGVQHPTQQVRSIAGNVNQALAMIVEGTEWFVGLKHDTEARHTDTLRNVVKCLVQIH